MKLGNILSGSPPWGLGRRRSDADPSVYQPLRLQTDRDASSSRPTTQPLDADAGGDAGNSAPPSPGHGQAPPPRDAAALMLLKLGRSPAQRTHVTPQDNDRVLRRIDLALLPLMLSVYFLHALDKATLSYASVFGLIDDTGLRGNQFSWLGSVVYLAQLIMQLPVAWALVKLPIGTFTSTMVLGWGVTLAAMTGARNFPALLGSRFLLGAFEASVGPSFVAITQMWWRRREQTMRVGSWYCMNGLTWVFGSLVTYGLARIESPLRPYQIIFLFFGAVTLVVAVAMFFWMPDSPTEAKFLSNNDKVIAIERLRDNQMGIMSREWRQLHFFESLCDLKTWLWVGMIFCASVPSSGVGTFGPLIIQSFVSDPFKTMLFNVPVGLTHLLSVSISAYVSMKWKLKGPVVAALCLPPIVGLSILISIDHTAENRNTLLAGFFCLSTFTGITPLIYSWSSQNTAGDTKRKTTSALVFIGSSAGNIVGPLLFTPDEAPAYARGLRANIAMFASVLGFVLLTSIHLSRLNRSHRERRVAIGKSAVVVDTSLESSANAGLLGAMQRGEEDGMSVAEEDHASDKGFSDATDLENEDFVFVF